MRVGVYMYNAIKNVFNFKKIANLLTVLILMFAVSWFLFGEKFSFYVPPVEDPITGLTAFEAYYRDFNGLEILTFEANYYQDDIPMYFNIFSLLMFVTLLSSLINLIVLIINDSKRAYKLKYVFGGLFFITLSMFTFAASYEYIIGPNSSGFILYISLYIGVFMLLAYDGVVVLIKKYLVGYNESKDSKGYYIVTSIYKVLDIEGRKTKKFYSLKKSEKYINKIKKENHQDIQINKNN